MKGVQWCEGRVVEDLDGAVAEGDEEVLWRRGVREGGCVGLELLLLRG